MANANDLRKGMCIRYNSNPAIVLEVMHRTPGNLRAFVQVIIRYIGTGKSADVRFGSTDKVDLVEWSARSWTSVTKITPVTNSWTRIRLKPSRSTSPSSAM